MTDTAARAKLEQIARMLDPGAWRKVVAGNPKLDIRRSVALQRAAKVIVVFAPELAQKDAHIRQTANQLIASDQQQIDDHQRALEDALQLVAKQRLDGVALDQDELRRICSEAIRTHAG